MRVKTIIPLIVVLLAAPCTADNLVYVRISADVIHRYLDLDPPTQAQRLDTLERLFRGAGCASENITRQTVPAEKQPNLICKIPGPSKKTIIIAARSDYKDKGAARKLRWGSLAILPMLAETLTGVSLHKTFLLLVYTGSRNGSDGDKWFIDHLAAEQRKNVIAIVDVASVGRSATTISTENEELRKWFGTACATLHFQNCPAREIGSYGAHWRSADPHVPSILVSSLPYKQIVNPHLVS